MYIAPLILGPVPASWYKGNICLVLSSEICLAPNQKFATKCSMKGSGKVRFF